jgi:Spy/CpxP family protein refolding chaperone
MDTERRLDLMKRFPRIAPIALVAFAAAAAARSDQGAGPHSWGRGMHHMDQCLAQLNLPESVKAEVDTALANGRTTLKTDREAFQAAHSQMKTDVANNADKSVIGQDTLNVDAAEKKMKADGKAMHDQVFALLSPDQQDTLRACVAPKGGKGGDAAPSTPSTQP